MGCNCKDAKRMRSIFGEKPANETVMDKLFRYIKTLFIILTTFIIGVVCIPFVLIVVIYNIFFHRKAYFNISDNFIKRFLGINNGEELQS